MKRSEALKLIDDYFSYFNYHTDAIGMLDFMEKNLKMLPPAYKDPELDGHRFAEATYRNEWEPE